MRATKIAATSAFLLKSTLKSKAAMLLVGALVLLTLLSVGSRLAVVREDTDSYRPVTVLTEEPSARRLMSAGWMFTMIPGQTSDYDDPATAIFNEDRALSLQISTRTLDDLLVVVLPFAALLLGASLSPARQSPVLTFMSAPISRGNFYVGHVLAAASIIALLCGIAWVAGALLLLLAVPAPWELIRLLTLMFAYSALYAMTFAGVGLSFGILIRKRTTGLVAGLVLIIVLVGVMPPVREMSMRSYFANHREAYIEYAEGGAVPTDAAWYLDRAIQHTPANALKTILFITETFSPVPRPGCEMCGGSQQPGRGYSVPGETLALAIAALSSVLIGGVAFLRKEIETA